MIIILLGKSLAEKEFLTIREAKELVQMYIFVLTEKYTPVVSAEIVDIEKFERMVTLASSFFNLIEPDESDRENIRSNTEEP